MQEAITKEILKQFHIILGAVRQHFSDIESACGISGSQLWLLSEISTNTELGVSQLAEKLAIHQSTCSLLLKKLVEKQLVVKRRLSEDHRKVGVIVTAEGHALLAKAPKPLHGILPQVLATLQKNDLYILKTSLQTVVSGLDNKTAVLAHHPLADL